MINTVNLPIPNPYLWLLRWPLYISLFLGGGLQAGLASASIAHICDQAAQVAASETGVPVAVMRSITRTETGRAEGGVLKPWPWTVNMEGKGRWFETEDAARAYVFKHFKRGARSFDVGCFQINYKWHHTAFRSIDEMFDPLANARYAADFLIRIHNETGDWSKTAGAYHSRTPQYAAKYRARFDRIHQDMLGQPVVRTASASSNIRANQPKKPRVNTFPLLQHRASGRSHGSLVPLGQGAGQSLMSLAKPLLGS